MVADPTCKSATTEESDRSGEPSAMHAIGDVRAHVARIGECLVQLVQVQADGIRAKVHRAVFAVLLTLAALIVVIAYLATVVNLLISGLAGGVSELVGNRVWLGNLITALFLLGVTAFAAGNRWTRFKAARLRILVEKYERRAQRRRDRFGRPPRTGGSRAE